MSSTIYGLGLLRRGVNFFSSIVNSDQQLPKSDVINLSREEKQLYKVVNDTFNEIGGMATVLGVSLDQLKYLILDHAVSFCNSKLKINIKSSVMDLSTNCKIRLPKDVRRLVNKKLRKCFFEESRGKNNVKTNRGHFWPRLFVSTLMLTAGLPSTHGSAISRRSLPCSGITSEYVESESSRLSCRNQLISSFCSSVSDGLSNVNSGVNSDYSAFSNASPPLSSSSAYGHAARFVNEKFDDALTKCNDLPTVSSNCQSQVSSISNQLQALYDVTNSINSFCSSNRISTLWCRQTNSPSIIKNFQSRIVSSNNQLNSNLFLLSNLPVKVETTNRPIVTTTLLVSTTKPVTKPSTTQELISSSAATSKPNDETVLPGVSTSAPFASSATEII